MNLNVNLKPAGPAQELGHNEATWEPAASLTSEEAAEAIAAFERRRPIAEELAERRPAGPVWPSGFSSLTNNTPLLWHLAAWIGACLLSIACESATAEVAGSA